jgi:GTP-binding protein Era
MLPSAPPDSSGPKGRAGFVGILGRPNVGKSTLLNQILGEKLAIATPRPQTTRNRLLAVKNVDRAQLVLLDTPGLDVIGEARPKALNRFMAREAHEVLGEVDVVLLLTDVRQHEPGQRVDLLPPPSPVPQGGGARISAADQQVLETLKKTGKPLVLAINKVDLLADKRQLLPVMEAWAQRAGAGTFAAIVPISALTGDGVDRLVAELCALLPEGPPLFPEEMVTDRAERWLVAEFIREKVFLATQKEVPYAVAVTVDAWEERVVKRRRRGDRVGVLIHATIHVEKEAQKRIVIGEGGRKIRAIGTAARADIEALLGCPVYLELFVRVDPGWSDRPHQLRELGYVTERTRDQGR